MDENLPGYAFTICAVAQWGCSAAKTITRRADGTLHKREYDNVTYWSLIALTVESPDADLAKVARVLAGENATAAMAAAMGALAGRRDLMIVIGATRPGHNPKHPCRRLWAQPWAYENTLFAAPRAWVPVDCDDIEVPDGLGAGDRLPEAATFIRDNLLPPEFANVECVASASASSGTKGPSIVRLRLFFLLAQAHELARLRSWGVAAQRAGLPVDPAVLQPGQPIYAARPRFINMTDPVPPEQWAFVLPGATGRVSLVADRYDIVSAAIERKVSQAAALSGGDWRRLLDATLGGPTRFFEPLTRALGVAAHTRESEDAIGAHVEALLRERADPGRQRQYGREWVLSTLKRFRGKDVKTSEQVDCLRHNSGSISWRTV